MDNSLVDSDVDSYDASESGDDSDVVDGSVVVDGAGGGCSHVAGRGLGAGSALAVSNGSQLVERRCHFFDVAGKTWLLLFVVSLMIG